MYSDILIRHIHLGRKNIIRIIYPSMQFFSDNIHDKVKYLRIYDTQALEVLGRRVDDVYLENRGKVTEPVIIEKVLFQPEARRFYNL